MTEQEYNDAREMKFQAERDWIDGQANKLDYIVSSVANFYADEIEQLLEMGFDVVCLVDQEKMQALEPMIASPLTGECEAFIVHNPTINLVLLSMSRKASLEWFIRS